MKRNTNQIAGRPPIYDWDKWLSRKRKFTLTRGKDFQCQTYSMCVQVRLQAKRRGISLHISMTGEELVISFSQESV